jgi:hypothetical protein
MVFAHKKEVISFKDFMSRPAPQIISKKTPLLPVYSFLPPISIKSIFPFGTDAIFTGFIIGCSLLLVIIVSEKLLAKNGFAEVSTFISTTMKVTLPVIAFGSAIYFLLKL